MSNFLERLRKVKGDRGMMANLRCYLVDSKKHRAWPALSRIGIDVNKRVAAAYVASFYALHPDEAEKGNFGTTCKRIEKERKEKPCTDNKLTPTERRFQQVLASDRNEVYERVMRMVKMAKSHNIPVNYGQLEQELRFWSDRTKAEWAAAFWAPGAIPVEEDI